MRCDNFFTLRRKAKGYSQQKLANITRINVRTIQDYEQHRRMLGNAKADTVRILAKALGCSMEKLLNEESKWIKDLGKDIIKREDTQNGKHHRK